jgi:hypothetical protein
MSVVEPGELPEGDDDNNDDNDKEESSVILSFGMALVLVFALL